MSVRTLSALVFFAIAVAGHAAPVGASAADGENCFAAADRVDAGETLSAAEIDAAHHACRRAIQATGSIVQKYQFEEADFAITGKRHEY